MAYLPRNLLSNPPVSPFSRSLKTHLFWFRGLQGLPPGATGIQWRVNIITFNRQSIIYHIQYVIVYIPVSYCSTNIVPPGAAGIQQRVKTRQHFTQSTFHNMLYIVPWTHNISYCSTNIVHVTFYNGHYQSPTVFGVH